MTTVSLSQFDQILGPTAAAHRSHPGRCAALAIVTKAVAHDVPQSVTRAWLRSRTPALAPWSALEPFGDLHGRAVRHVGVSATQGGRARVILRLSRVLLGSICSPVPETVTAQPRSVATARAVTVLVARQAMRREAATGMPGVMMPAVDLAVALGVTQPTARRGLKLAVDCGWLREMPARRGHTKPHRVASRMPRERSMVAWALGDHVDCLARTHSADVDDAPVDDTGVVSMLDALEHPAVGYGGGLLAWQVGLAEILGLDPVDDLGMARSSVRRHATSWHRVVPVGTPASQIHDHLEAYAVEQDLWAQRGKAEAERAAKRIARAVAVEQHKVVVDRARLVISALQKKAPMPRANSDAASKKAWLEGAGRALRGADIDDAVRAQIAKQLAMTWARTGFLPSTQCNSLAAQVAHVGT